MATSGDLWAKDVQATHRLPVLLLTLFLPLVVDWTPISFPKELSIVNSVFQGRRSNLELVMTFRESPKWGPGPRLTLKPSPRV